MSKDENSSLAVDSTAMDFRRRVIRVFQLITETDSEQGAFKWFARQMFLRPESYLTAVVSEPRHPHPKTVARWARPNEPRTAPDEAWERLRELEDVADQIEFQRRRLDNLKRKEIRNGS